MHARFFLTGNSAKCLFWFKNWVYLFIIVWRKCKESFSYFFFSSLSKNKTREEIKQRKKDSPADLGLISPIIRPLYIPMNDVTKPHTRFEWIMRIKVKWVTFESIYISSINAILDCTLFLNWGRGSARSYKTRFKWRGRAEIYCLRDAL